MDLKNEFGKHYLIELIECDLRLISYLEEVKPILLKATADCRATILNQSFHQFQPHGVSGLLFLSESHFALHTWPEKRYVGADIFTCGKEMDANVAIETLQDQFRSREVKVRVVSRGF